MINDLQRCEAESGELQGCERQYENALAEKSAAVKAAGGVNAEEILKLEDCNLFLKSQEKELQEAISVGSAALATANQVLSSLDSAKGLGTLNLFGGGLIADLAKYGHLDVAQGTVEQLQSQLRRFKTELADVTIYADMQVSVDGIFCFADFFFDGMFADWAVMDKISRSQSQVQDTRNQISSVLSRLNEIVSTVENEQAQVKTGLTRLSLGHSFSSCHGKA